MIGNVWEWTASAYGAPGAHAEKPSCCQSKERAITLRPGW